MSYRAKVKFYRNNYRGIDNGYSAQDIQKDFGDFLTEGEVYHVSTNSEFALVVIKQNE